MVVRVTVVMYHYVRDMHKTKYPRIKGLLIEKFRGQLAYILRHYQVIRLEDYLDFLSGGKVVPENSCVLTFDDGFKDHYATVFPILRELDLPAAFFPQTQPLVELTVPPVHKTHFLLAKIGALVFAQEVNSILRDQFPDLVEEFSIQDKIKKNLGYRWDDALTVNLKWSIATMPHGPKVEILGEIFGKYFEDERGFCKELYMTWDEIREMKESGLSFGSHTHTHPALSELSEEDQVRELKDSKDVMAKEFGEDVTLFAYPYGSFNDVTLRILRKLYVCGLTTRVGVNEGRDEDPFTLKRLDTNDLPHNP